MIGFHDAGNVGWSVLCNTDQTMSNRMCATYSSRIQLVAFDLLQQSGY